MALGTVNYKMNPMIFLASLRLMNGQIIAMNLSRLTRGVFPSTTSAEE